MGGGPEFLVSHHAREDFLVAFHSVDEKLIEHPLQIGRKVGEVVGLGGFNNLFVFLGAGAYLVEEQLIGAGEVPKRSFSFATSDESVTPSSENPPVPTQE